MATQRDFLKNAILERLEKKLVIYGFNLNKSLPGFRKKTVYGWQDFHLVFLIRHKGWEIKPGLLVRFNIIEDIYHQVSSFEKKYQKGTHTIGVSIEDLEKNEMKGRFDLYEESQIDYVENKLFELFKSIALPFFDMYSNIKAIDKVLNGNPENTSLTGSIFKGTKSLIIAKLLEREDFAKLEQIYQTYYENFANGFYLSEYSKLKDYLGHAPLGSVPDKAYSSD